jgi:hypothetical protein
VHPRGGQKEDKRAGAKTKKRRRGGFY